MSRASGNVFMTICFALFPYSSSNTTKTSTLIRVYSRDTYIITSSPCASPSAALGIL
jgi:hypothetical protein